MGGGIKVYGAVKAACPQRVMACLMELQEDFEFVHIDLQSGEHKKPAYLIRQPFGQVPVIEDGDFRLYESRAIIRYLANKYTDRSPKLLGTTLQERAMVDQWLDIEAHHFNDMIYTLVLNLLIFPKPDLDLVNTCQKKLEKVLDVYETRLSTSKYLAGDSYTVADLSHIPGIRYLVEDLRMPHLVSDRKNVSAWWEEISARPAWKKVLSLVAT